MKRNHNTFYFIDEENDKKSLPIHQIENIYLFGKLDMNTDFLNLLNQHQVAMHLFNYYGFYSGSFIPRQQKVSGFTVVNQSAHYLDKDKRLYIAREFVGSAIFHMLRNLRRYRHRDGMVQIIEKLELYRTQLYDMNSIAKV